MACIFYEMPCVFFRVPIWKEKQCFLLSWRDTEIKNPAETNRRELWMRDNFRYCLPSVFGRCAVVNVFGCKLYVVEHEHG